MPFTDPDSLDQLCVAPEDSLQKVIETVGHGAKQIAVVIAVDRTMLGIITDGDVRRAILQGVSLDTPAHEVMTKEFVFGHVNMNSIKILNLMGRYSLRHIPLLDDQRKLVDLVWITDLLKQGMSQFDALIMAGGFGKRLQPLTDDIPKPLLPVGDRPIMELIIDQLRYAGADQFHVSTHYLAEKIVDHFGNGSQYGVHIEYINEEHPLGTAGALGLMEPLERPLLVINGDILTQLDFQAMMAFHEDNDSKLTVAVKEYSVDVPYGVLQTDGVYIRGLQEKPTLRFFINAGIYLVSPEAQKLVPKDRPYNMTDLIEQMIANGERVTSFPIQEYWMDIGQHVDYEQAQIEIKKERWASWNRTVANGMANEYS